MTTDDQQAILQMMFNHMRDNVGNRITEVVANGFMNVLQEITTKRLTKETENAPN